jgi:outer membrane protein assembly factor BamA
MIGKFILFSAFLAVNFSVQAQTPQQKFLVEFEGNKVFSSDILLQKLNSCAGKYSNPEEKYDANLYEYCLRKDVLGFLRSQGYLRARIGEPKSQESEQILKVIVSVEEGIRYRLGNVNVQGTKVFTSEQLLEKLNLKTGEIAVGQELREWLFERVKKLYGNTGYIESDFDIEAKFKTIAKGESDGIADFEVVVDEGPRFTKVVRPSFKKPGANQRRRAF